MPRIAFFPGFRMTLTTEYAPKEFIADGLGTPRTIEFELRRPEDLRVEADGVAQVQGTHYAVTGAFPSQKIEPIAPYWANGAIIAYWRETASRQEYDIEPGESLRAKSLEDELDRGAMQRQEQNDEIARSPKFARGATVYDIGPIAEGQALALVGGKVVGVENPVSAQVVLDSVKAVAVQVTTNAGLVSTAKTQAIAAKDEAVGARDIVTAALANNSVQRETTIAAAKTAGLAAVSEGETFVATADDVAYAGIYRKVGGAADELIQLPKADWLAAQLDLVSDATEQAAMIAIARLQGYAGTGRLFDASSISEFGATLYFDKNYLVGKYVAGGYWAYGPIGVKDSEPKCEVIDGVYGSGTPYSGRTINGMVVDPGNRRYATDGLAENNSQSSLQGWDSLPPEGGAFGGDTQTAAYDPDLNVDPGKTGETLWIETGTIVKAISKIDDVSAHPVVADLITLNVVDEIPPPDAIRPGMARASTKHTITTSMFDMSVFKSLPAPATAPTYAEALDAVSRFAEVSTTVAPNARNVQPENHNPPYGRDIGNQHNRALMALHMDHLTIDQKREILAHLAVIADDLLAAAEEGKIVPGAGGGNGWKKPQLVVTAAALKANASASMLAYVDWEQNNVWHLDRQMFQVEGVDIALPRASDDGRPRDPYTTQMFGATDWGEQALTAPDKSGSNWNAFYRDVVAGQALGGVLSVRLTAGAEALWNHPEFFTYMATAFDRRAEFSDGNDTIAVVEDMMAHWPADTAVPTLTQAIVRDAAISLGYDIPLDELATLPATSDFTVTVNGSPVTVSSVGIFRTQLYLTLAAAVTGNDTVAISYTAGANAVQTIYGTNVANLSAQALTNRSEKVGGPNPVYPIVRFTPGVTRKIGGTAALAAADNARGTLAFLKHKIAALPSTPSTILGAGVGTPPVQMLINANGNFEVRLVSAAGSPIARIQSNSIKLAADTEYDIFASWDMTQATAAAGFSLYINGTACTFTSLGTWGGGSGVKVGYTLMSQTRWGHSEDLTFDFGAFWLDATARLDLSNSANRDLFFSTTGGDLDIGTLGDGITGSRPAQFDVGNDDQWNDSFGINRGTGNRFFREKGEVVSVSGAEWE